MKKLLILSLAALSTIAAYASPTIEARLKLADDQQLHIVKVFDDVAVSQSAVIDGFNVVFNAVLVEELHDAIVVIVSVVDESAVVFEKQITVPFDQDVVFIENGVEVTLHASQS